MNYKVKSINTTKYISLHDCCAKKLFLKGSALTIEMEWMEIYAEHPENPNNKAHSSDEGVIVFEDVIVLDVAVNDEKSSDASFQEYNDTIIMGFEEINVNSAYRYGVLDFLDNSDGYVCITFLFKKSVIMWNELTKKSWFEDRRFKPDISNEELLKMLSYKNTIEIQEKGIRLASEIKWLGHLFQPTIGGESKSLWENCALVLSKKTDEQLCPWLIDCFIWLQDMNWPGAEIIADRLKIMRDTENYEYNKEKAIKIAEITNDEEWIENIRQYL